MAQSNTPIDPAKVQWDSIDANAVKWDEPAQPQEGKRGTLGRIADVAGTVLRLATPAGTVGALASKEGRADLVNAIAGGVRGAGSIGATVLAPYDAARDALDGKGLSLESNRQRRTDMTGALESMGADPNSSAFQVGKVSTEVGGTMGTGGALANGAVGAVPALGKVAPGLIEAVRTGGMAAKGAGMGTRIVGGAINGGASAGLVNPEDAGTGAEIGGAAPVVAKVLGAAGQKVGSAINERLAERLKDYQRNGQLNKTIEDAIEAGYVIPPSSVKPTFGNRVLESVSGKQATQQIVSTKNAKVTDDLVRKSLGIPENVPLSQGALENLRKTAGKAYQEVSSLSPQAAADLEALKTARNEAQGWFKAYNRSARPDDLAKAKEARQLSDNLEQALEKHAEQAGKPDLIPALRDARKQIAKTYTVGRAINDASGNVDARVLGRLYEKHAPLSGELETAGRFASAFPTAAKSPQQMGSPDVHNLRAMASILMSGGGAGAGAAAGLGAAATGGLSALAAAVPMVAPPVARSVLLRKGAQHALIPKAPQGGKAAQLAELLRNQDLLENALRAAPVTAASTRP